MTLSMFIAELLYSVMYLVAAPVKAVMGTGFEWLVLPYIFLVMAAIALTPYAILRIFITPKKVA